MGSGVYIKAVVFSIALYSFFHFYLRPTYQLRELEHKIEVRQAKEAVYIKENSKQVELFEDKQREKITKSREKTTKDIHEDINISIGRHTIVL